MHFVDRVGFSCLVFVSFSFVLCTALKQTPQPSVVASPLDRFPDKFVVEFDFSYEDFRGDWIKFLTNTDPFAEPEPETEEGSEESSGSKPLKQTELLLEAAEDKQEEPEFTNFTNIVACFDRPANGWWWGGRFTVPAVSTELLRKYRPGFCGVEMGTMWREFWTLQHIVRLKLVDDRSKASSSYSFVTAILGGGHGFWNITDSDGNCIAHTSLNGQTSQLKFQYMDNFQKNMTLIVTNCNVTSYIASIRPLEQTWNGYRIRWGVTVRPDSPVPSYLVGLVAALEGLRDKQSLISTQAKFAPDTPESLRKAEVMRHYRASDE